MTRSRSVKYLAMMVWMGTTIPKKAAGQLGPSALFTVTPSMTASASSYSSPMTSPVSPISGDSATIVAAVGITSLCWALVGALVYMVKRRRQTRPVLRTERAEPEVIPLLPLSQSNPYNELTVPIRGTNV